MSDEIESQLAELEKAAPLTADPNDLDEPVHFDSSQDGADDPAPEGDAGEQEKAGSGAEAAAEGDSQDKPPLTQEELQTRWENEKKAKNEERQKRRDLEQRLWALENGQAQPRNGQGNGQSQPQTAQARQQFQQPMLPPGYDPAADKEPEPEQFARSRDPDAEYAVAHYQWLQRQHAYRDVVQKQESEQRQQAERQQQQRNVALQQIHTRTSDYEAEFKEDHPDYDERVQFVANHRMAFHAARGLSPEKAKLAVTREFLMDAAALLDAGRNPAETIYNLAEQVGYTPKQESPAAQAQPNQNGKLDQRRAGQDAAKSLSGGGGRGPSGDGSLKAIAALDGEEFDKAFDRFLRS